MKSQIHPKPSTYPKPYLQEIAYINSYNGDGDDYESTTKERGAGAGICGFCCTPANGFTQLGLALAIIGVLFLVAIAAVIPLIFVLKNAPGNSTNSSHINIPKRLGVYYGWPSLVDGANWNLTAAIDTFAQFDLVVFGDGIEDPSHGDHANTQTIIQALNARSVLTFGYVDLGVITQNLSIVQMQIAVNNWTAMGIQGIMWDDAGYDYGVTRSRQNTMVSYCHSLNLKVMMNAWEPDDVMGGSPMLLVPGDIYLLESYLLSNGAYQNLTLWKIKADKCLSYASSLGISMATLATDTPGIVSSFGSSAGFSQAWYGTAMYNFQYFQMTDIQYSSSNNILYAFPNLLSSYGTTWQTNNIQTDAITHYYRSTDTYTLHIYGDGATYGYGNFTMV